MRHRARGWCATGVAVLSMLAGLPCGAAADAAEPQPAPVRVLIVGDSVAQGSAGDWTWRYRLWQALDEAGVAVDLVGPRDDVFDNVVDQPGSQAYADPDFDRDHAARWGMSMWSPDVSMGDLVEEYHPDVVIETRGINDVSYTLNARELTEVLADEIDEARAVDPAVDFVVAALPQTWVAQVESYNAGLPGLAASMSVSGSRVVVAQAGEQFVRGVDTWDPAHLSATGELKMAAAVADALAELGVGPGYAGPLPAISNGHWGVATEVEVEAGDGQASLSWVRPPGCPLTYVWRRDKTLGEEWTRPNFPVSGTTWIAGALTNGHVYEFRLQSAKGTAVADASSPAVEVTPQAVPDPAPLPGQVAALGAIPGPRQLTVDWDEVAGATSYVVSWVGADDDGGLASVTAPPLIIPDLVGGRSYVVTVVARNDGGAGQPNAVTATPEVPDLPVPDPVPDPMPDPVPDPVPVPVPVPDPVAGSKPGPVSGVVAAPGRHRLSVTWGTVPAATSYEVAWVGRTTGRHGRRAVAAGPLVVAGLIAGERYTVSVTARNALGAGSSARVAGTPRGPRVAGPARLRVASVGARGARLTWRDRPAATSYAVSVRRHGRWETVRTTKATSIVVRGLPAGVARLRVRSWHQLVGGAWSSVVRLRVPG